MAQVLLFNFGGRRLKGALAAAAAVSAAARVVAPDGQRHTIGYLLEFDGFISSPPDSEPPFAAELAVVYGFDDGMLESFISLLNGLTPKVKTRPMKAVVTAQNMTWTARALFRELAAERLALESIVKR